MLIDFHIHFFPDAIAAATVKKLGEEAGVNYHGDGTLSSASGFMKRDGVAYSVNQPVATRPEQVHSINKKMVQINSTGIPVICFGGMHPCVENPGEEIAYMKENGIKGIKMHPEYQNFYPDSDEMSGIYEACRKNDMMILFHAGRDIAYPDVHGTPERFARVLSTPGLRVVLAHMGGWRMWDEVEKHLAGKNVYFDVSYCDEMENAQMKRIISCHGSEKILFATDFPWERAPVMSAKIAGLGLGRAAEENIYFKNAAALLGLNIA